jgi:hypothetical protein
MGKRPRGPQPNWQPSTDRQKAVLADAVDRYRQHEAEGTLDRGPRGILYDLRPSGFGRGVTYRKYDSEHPKKSFGPMEAHQDIVQEVLVHARRAGIIPEHWVADKRAPSPIGDSYDESAEDAADSIARIVRNAEKTFRLDPQRFQPVYVEVSCEAEDLSDRVARIAREPGVNVYPGSGFDGLKGKRAFAERARRRAVPTVVLHIGDFDLHGENIYLAAAEDSVAWNRGAGQVMPLDWEWRGQLRQLRERFERFPALIFVRLALTKAQALDLDLLDSDGKAEADGIPVTTLDGWVREAIDELHDPACRERHASEQEAEAKRLPDLIRDKLQRPPEETS